MSIDLSIFSFDFVFRALLLGGVVGAWCGALGVFLVLRRLTFVGEGLAHAAFAGASFGMLLHLSPLVGGIGASTAGALLLALPKRESVVREDAYSTLLFASMVSLGILVISWSPQGSASALALLFGSLLQITRQEVYQTCTLLVCLVGIFLLLWKKFVVVTFDEDHARLLGYQVNWLKVIFSLIVALTVVMAVRIVGSVLVSSLLVIPPILALRQGKEFTTSVFLASAIGALLVEGGLVCSLLFDTPPGATVTLLGSIVLVCSHVLKIIRSR